MKNLFDRKRDWFIPILGLILVFILAARTPIDSDMWWHLKAGEQTWTTARPVMADDLSFTRFGAGWINHSWLSQVGMYLLFEKGGFLTLGAGMALLATLSMGFVYLQMSGPQLLKAFLLIFGSTVTAVVWSPRPQLVSLVLLAIVAFVLYLFKWKSKNQLKWLPVLFFLWSNLHGGWPLGFLLIGAMVAGELSNHLLGNTSTNVLKWGQVRSLVIWSLVSAVALLINPNGFAIWKIPFQTVEVSTLQQFIQEWASPDFHELFQQPFLWLLFAILAAVGFSRRRMDATDFISVVLFAYMGLVARRNFGPFGIVALPVLSRYLWPTIQSLQGLNVEEPEWQADEPSSRPRIRPRWQRRINLVIVGILAVVALGKLYIVTYPGMMNAAIHSSEPAGAVDWMIDHQIKGRVFNEYNWGGYLAWRTSDVKVFVDGRTDLFGDEILGEWLTATQAGTGWQQILAKWKVDYVLIDPGRPLAQVLADNGWKLLYKDAHAVVYAQ
jgi:hypothetical protein